MILAKVKMSIVEPHLIAKVPNFFENPIFFLKLCLSCLKVK